MLAKSDYPTLALFCLLAATMADITIDAVSNRAGVFKAVAGTTVPVSGKLTGPIRPPDRPRSIFDNLIEDPARIAAILVCEPDHAAFRVRFLAFEGRFWRAELQVESSAAAGDYNVRVRQRSLPPDPEAPSLLVRIFADERALRAAQASLLRRYAGIAPWAAALVLLPPAFLLIHRTWRRAEDGIAALQARGIGPIYKMAYRKTGWEILFGLGSDHGLRNGDELLLLDARHRPSGHTIVALRVDRRSGAAVVDPAVDLGPGFVVCRPPPAEAENSLPLLQPVKKADRPPAQHPPGSGSGPGARLA